MVILATTLNRLVLKSGQVKQKWLTILAVLGPGCRLESPGGYS